MTRSRRLAAVWFADIAGYTDLSSRDEEAALKAVDELQRLSKESVEAHRGRIVKYVGDAVLTVFDSADAALRSALELQDGFTALGIEECGLRVGVHLGEVVEADDGDIYGDGVNVASRIEGQAEAGQVVVSEDVHRLLRQQAEHSFKPFGPVKLKGVEEPMWLYVVGAPEAAVPAVREPSVPESTALYNAVTQHWPKIALGSVGAAVGAGFAFGRIAGVSLQSYVFAWAATTAGIWFLFDKAEAAMSARSRRQVVGWLGHTSSGLDIQTIPEQFILLFDRVFGERHLTLRCFTRSSVASICSVAITAAALLAVFRPSTDLITATPVAFGLAVAVNVIPDYLSLLETRWIIKFAVWSDMFVLALLLDLLATYFIAGFIWVQVLMTSGQLLEIGSEGSSILTIALVVGMISTFFTSCWLWLYVAAEPLSRLLLRMNSGVGFLLRVTDVERQPFRSMGFVSVIIVSALFALGLPLVLL